MFFGLPIPVRVAERIDAWRRLNLPTVMPAVPAVNYHVTLLFLGDVDTHAVDRLCRAAAQLPAHPFGADLCELGYWPKPGILWLGPAPAAPFAALHAALRRAAAECRIATEKRAYQPHLTLARRCDAPPAPGFEAPSFPIDVDRLVLFESLATRRGVRYEPRWERTL